MDKYFKLLKQVISDVLLISICIWFLLLSLFSFHVGGKGIIGGCLGIVVILVCNPFSFRLLKKWDKTIKKRYLIPALFLTTIIILIIVPMDKNEYNDEISNIDLDTIEVDNSDDFEISVSPIVEVSVKDNEQSTNYINKETVLVEELTTNIENELAIDEDENLSSVEKQSTPTTEVEPTPTLEVKPTPTVEVKPTPTVEVKPTPTVEIKPTPTLEANPTQDAVELIYVKYGEIGTVGKKDKFDREYYIRHYLPAGKYKAKSLSSSKGTGFYIESIKKHKEDGYETTDVYETYKFNKEGSTLTFEIKEGQCIFTFIGTHMEIEKLD